MKFALRGQVCFEKCILQRLSYTTRVVGNHSVTDNFYVSKNNFIRIYGTEKENDFNVNSKYLLKSTDLAHTLWSLEHSSHNSHSLGHECGSSSNGGGGQRWSLASVLALSLISTKTEGEEERKESELIIMIKRGILALKVGCQALLL